jgi:hypothetical protein
VAADRRVVVRARPRGAGLSESCLGGYGDAIARITVPGSRHIEVRCGAGALRLERRSGERE